MLAILLGASAGCGGEAGTTDGTLTSGAGGAGGGLTTACGDGICKSDEDCRSCQADCGICAACEAPSCASAATPINAPEHYAKLEVLDEGSERIRGRLLEQLERGDDRMAVLLAAIDTEGSDSDPAWMLAARRAAAAHPEVASKLRARFASLGIDRPRGWLSGRSMGARGSGLGLGPRALMGGDPGSTVECGKPFLRIRASKLKVYASTDIASGDDIYCVVAAEAPSGSEARVTPFLKHLLEGAVQPLSLDEGVVWGSKGAKAPEGAIVLTYRCVESSDYTQVNAFLEELSKQFEEFGGLADSFGYGWVVDAAQGVLGIIEAALALDTDKVLLTAQQTLYPDIQYDLVKGVFWEVRKSGKVGAIPWDYGIVMEAWGCGELAQ